MDGFHQVTDESVEGGILGISKLISLEDLESTINLMADKTGPDWIDVIFIKKCFYNQAAPII